MTATTDSIVVDGSPCFAWILQSNNGVILARSEYKYRSDEVARRAFDHLVGKIKAASFEDWE